MDYHPPVKPVKYVLYSHFGYHEREDYNLWAKGTACAELEGVQYLLSHIESLRHLLTSQHYEGLLVLFYAPDSGFADCLKGIARGMSKNYLRSKRKPLKFADEVASYIRERLRADNELSYRLRFVTPLDLYDIFGRMNWATAINLKWWFIGSSQVIHYDTPKIVEAIVRLRLLGTGVPVFRADWDVLFRDPENVNDHLSLFKAIALCLTTHQLRRDEASISTFIFSASYDANAILNATQPGEKFTAWSCAFATRVFPALPVNQGAIRRIGPDYTWGNYAEDVFDEDLARKFYGLAQNGLRSNGITGIGEIGAHPLVSVISGALFCLSESAILDLPPFSNFGLNVSWIDDHLKFCLHRELKHLFTSTLDIEPGTKLDDAVVQKARATIADLPEYVLGKYLPTLLWGTIMDAWIAPNPILHHQWEDLCEEDRAEWERLQREPSQGVLSVALKTALEKGHIDKGEKQELRIKLVKVTLERINKVRRQWAQLTRNNLETFASIWAKGTVKDYFPDLVACAERCRGITEPGIPLDKEIEDVFQINHYLYDDFRVLLDDAIDYIEWSLHWPQIVQVVRSVEPGTLKTDVSWWP